VIVASITALAAGVTEMMYLAFAPRSMADVGTIVELSENIVSRATIAKRTLLVAFLRIAFPLTEIGTDPSLGN
jgi:hypothetical protein